MDEEDVLADLEAALLDARLKFLVGGARVGGALERDDLAGPKVRHERVHGVGHVAEVRLAVLVERRRHADDERVAILGVGEVGRRRETFLDRVGDLLGRDVLDVGLAGGEEL